MFAKSVIVLGEVVGNVTGTEKVDIRDNGSVDGDIVSPRVAIAEGAHFRGSVDMKRSPAAGATPERKVEAKVEPAGACASAAVVWGSPGGQSVGRTEGRSLGAAVNRFEARCVRQRGARALSR